MANTIKMENLYTGEIVEGFYGYSWTTLFFGAFPALFRKDFITFFIGAFVLMMLTIYTLGTGALVAMVIWSFMYNKFYTTSLLKKGFAFAGTHEENLRAAASLSVRLNANNCLTAVE